MRVTLFFLLLAFSSLVQAEIYRCGNAYSHTPCAGASTVDTTPALATQPDPSSDSVNLCKSYSGGLFWTKKRCSEHQSTLERTITVPADLPWHQQLNLARTAHRQAQALTRPTFTSYKQPRATSTRQRCEQLKRRIAELEGLARSGRSGRSMSRITQERRDLESERFKLKCPVRP